MWIVSVLQTARTHSWWIRSRPQSYGDDETAGLK
jgi:hypothetical protein